MIKETDFSDGKNQKRTRRGKRMNLELNLQ